MLSYVLYTGTARTAYQTRYYTHPLLLVHLHFSETHLIPLSSTI
jgi:hypothetical protein